MHPLGKSPIITITPAGSAGEPVTIAESGFIVEYLISHFGQKTSLQPKQWKDGMEGKVAGETEGYLRYKYFLQYVEGSLGTPLLVNVISRSEFSTVLGLVVAMNMNC